MAHKRIDPTSSIFERFIIDKMERDQSWRMFRIMGEFVEGFDRLRGYDPSVTIYGSARTLPGDPAYTLAEELAARLAKLGYAVITGGGPGVMEAANKGASAAGGPSIGLTIDLANESPNRYSNVNINFHYFFVRKVMLVWRATAFVLLPGGLGTLDELFETLTLIATEKITRFPVILVGSSYWSGLAAWLRESAIPGGFISEADIDTLMITDDLDEAVQTIEGWRESGQARNHEI